MTIKKQLTAQSKLIGEHPCGGFFFEWFECEDTSTTSSKKHRRLTDKGSNRDTIIAQLAQWIIKHHAKDSQLARIKKKKEILDKHGFAEYIEANIPFPTKSTKTQKGNLGEIILAEYLSETSGLEILVYKLKYNPNIEQSMKGDDLLLFDKQDIKSKVIMGESKFRATKSKQALDDIVKSLSSEKLPISLPFVRERLEEMGHLELSEEIDDLITVLHKRKTPIIYVGFYHSEVTVNETIENNLNSNNKNLVIVSYGEDNPAELIKSSFDKAIEMLKE